MVSLIYIVLLYLRLNEQSVELKGCGSKPFVPLQVATVKKNDYKEFHPVFDANFITQTAIYFIEICNAISYYVQFIFLN